MDFRPIPRAADTFQQPVSAETIRAIISHTFGTNVQSDLVREFGSGLFNNTYYLRLNDGGEFVLRIAPTKDTPIATHERNLLRREQRLEPHFLAAGDWFPRTIASDFSHNIVERDWVVQTFLQGELWDEVKGELNSAENTSLWGQMADIANAIHAQPGTGFDFPGATRQYDRWSDAVLGVIAMMRDDMARMALDRPLSQQFAKLVAAGSHWLDEIQQPYLLHGDLWEKNVLIDRSGAPPRITGLLDAERGMWGDPRAEWVILFWDLPDTFWNNYQRGRYGDSPGQRFRQLCYRGWFQIQVVLEAPRFNHDDNGYWESLKDTITEMEALLAKHSASTTHFERKL
jgi:aminoglycoside phosphotransferase (APT) family kinase protein